MPDPTSRPAATPASGAAGAGDAGGGAAATGGAGTAGGAAARSYPRFAGWHQILVPVRGGADAYIRAELAMRIAAGTGARVTALYVVDDRLLADPDAGLVRETLSQQLAQEGEQLLAEIATIADGTDVRVTMRVAQGPVVETILKVAEEIGADAIVVGAHKQTWLGRLLGGSLAESILRAANCTVLAVPPAKT